LLAQYSFSLSTDLESCQVYEKPSGIVNVIRADSG